MFDALREKKLGVRIILGLVVGFLGIGMLLYLVPQNTGTELTGADVVAEVGDELVYGAALLRGVRGTLYEWRIL